MGSANRESREKRGLAAPSLLAACLLLTVPAPAFAQPSAGFGAPPPPPQASLVALGGDGSVEGSAAPSLKRLFGLPRAMEMLESPDGEERLRGIERLGRIGSDDALGGLVLALEQGSALGREPRARLVAVRCLAPHVAKEGPRRWLTREAADAGEARDGETPLARLTRETAAFALARSGDAEALGDLARLVAQGGPAAAGAKAALVANPPASLQALTGKGERALPPTLIALLAELGDLRAIPRLRKLAAEREPAVASAAILALARLGDAAALGPARALRAHADERLARAGTEALVRLGAPETAGAIAGLLRRESTRSFALALALESPDPSLVPDLVRYLPLLSPDERPTAVAALGRAGGPEAVKKLVTLLDDGTLATAAAHALATLPGAEARSALGQAFAKPGAAGLRALRASVVRGVVLGDPPEGLVVALETRLVHTDPTARAVAAFGLVALGERDPASLADGKDAALTIAALRGALVRGPEALAFALPLFVRLSRTSPESALTVAASAALAGRPDAAGLSATELALLAEAGGAAAPLAALALARRDQPLLRPRILRLLQGSDPIVRAHTGLGLALSAEPDATTLLGNAYGFESDARVRRALVRALAARPGQLRERTLELAATLDPDGETRAVARGALEGNAAFPAQRGSAVAWLEVLGAGGTASGRFVRSDGLALPVASDPDGVLLLPGTPDGDATLVLAPPTPPREPAAQ
jgi:HEAT repeat protein